MLRSALEDAEWVEHHGEVHVDIVTVLAAGHEGMDGQRQQRAAQRDQGDEVRPGSR